MPGCRRLYTANFVVDKDGFAIPSSEEQVCSPADIRVEGTEGVCAAGNGFEVYPELEKLAGNLGILFAGLLAPRQCHQPPGSQVARNNEPLPAAQAQPVYIRNQVAFKPA